MKPRLVTLSILSAILVASPSAAVEPVAASMTAAASHSAILYPETAKYAVSDTLFGETIADPYRWLENDVRTDPRVRDWVTAENAATHGYLDTLPGRDSIAARLTALYDYERYGTPIKAGSRYFYTHNSGLQNQASLYVRDGLNAPARMLIDPNLWAKDGATALAEWKPSHDGSLLVYAVQDGGTDWRTIKVLDGASGKVTADEVKWAKFTSLAWARNGSGFFYSRFAEPAEGEVFQSLNLNQTLYFHRIGTPQSADIKVYATPDRPKLSHVAEVTDDGKWLLVYSSEGTDNRFEVTMVDLTTAEMTPRTLVRGLDNNWELAGNQGPLFYFLTNLDAPRQRLVTIDVASSTRNIREIVPQGDATLESAEIIGDRLVLSYLRDARSEARLYSLAGKPVGTVALPGIGSIGGFSGEAGDPESFFSFASFNLPTTIYRFDSATGETSVFAQPKTAFDPAAYEVSQRFYESKDGTKVPLFVVHKKGLSLSGGAPTILYGYGGFNVPVTPTFSPATLAWMEMGGVYAQASIRGGGEYGKEWHNGGRLANKQNVFDDFIAAGEYLIAEGITAKDKLAVRGGSNGGLLVGAVINQRPDLFAVGLPAVGVMDMLRFNRFTAGRYWVDDYGDPAQEDDFRRLRSYSPYHNIREGADYPAILITTADTDDRVVPGHSFKYAAALQAAALGPKPHLIRIETRAGHGAGKPTDKIIREYADLWAFAAKWTGLPVPLDP
jgi:prolyl oligopeptidase